MNQHLPQPKAKWHCKLGTETVATPKGKPRLVTAVMYGLPKWSSTWPRVSEHDLCHKYFRWDAVLLHSIDLFKHVLNLNNWHPSSQMTSLLGHWVASVSHPQHHSSVQCGQLCAHWTTSLSDVSCAYAQYGRGRKGPRLPTPCVPDIGCVLVSPFYQKTNTYFFNKQSCTLQRSNIGPWWVFPQCCSSHG